jgi:PAS domain S-box-containing protein
MNYVRQKQLGIFLLLFACLILLLLTWITYRSWQELKQGAAQAESSRRVVRLNNQVLELVKDAETGQRGFVLTGKQSYLRPYESAVTSLPAVMSDLKTASTIFRDIHTQVSELDSLTAEKLRELRQTVDVRRSAGLAEAIRIVDSDVGQQTMSSIRRVSAHIREGALARTTEFSDRTRNRTQRTEVLSVGGALAIAILLACATVQLIRTTKQRERLFAELEESNLRTERIRDLLHVTLSSIGDGVITTDRDGKITFLNRVAERLTGWKNADAAGQQIATVFRIVNEKSRVTVPSPIEKVLQSGLTVGLANHTVLISKSGEDIPIDDSGAPIRGSDQEEIRGVVLVFRDVSERKKSEAVLRESEERFRNMADAAPVLIWTAATDKTCEYLNRRWLEFTGQPLEEALGWEWRKGIHPDDVSRFLQIYDAAFDARLPFTTEYRLRRFDGQYRLLLENGVPRFDQEGRFSGYIGSCVDIEDQRRTEEHLRQSAKLESLGVLAGGIAHDFNNLLVGILGSASLLDYYLPQESAARDTVDSIQKAAERAAALTHQMLAYSGRGRFSVSAVELSAEVEQITALVHAAIPRNVELQLQLAKGLPSVIADTAQLQQLVMNLVINAAEAIGQQSGTVVVKTQAVNVPDAEMLRSVDGRWIEPGEYVVLSVSDNGAGMDEGTRTKIFDPFFTTKFTGRGLGLAAVLGIVRGHNGGILLESVPGSGTTFQVYLPAGGESQTAERREERPTIVGGTGKILVVDDEATVRRTLQQNLEKLGYEAIFARDGNEAVSIFEQISDQVKVILLDLTMPVMSGAQALPKLRQLRPDVPIIASSGYSEAEAAEEFENGFDAFLQKPYTTEQLASVLRSVLRGFDC